MNMCLDAWAVIAWLEDSATAPHLEAHLGTGRSCMSWVNAGEVHCVVARRASPQAADQVISQLGADVDLMDATGPRTIAAAGIKAIHRMSYADCFAVATALEFRVPLVTSDPEIICANVPGLEVIDLRGASPVARPTHGLGTQVAPPPAARARPTPP